MKKVTLSLIGFGFLITSSGVHAAATAEGDSSRGPARLVADGRAKAGDGEGSDGMGAAHGGGDGSAIASVPLSWDQPWLGMESYDDQSLKNTIRDSRESVRLAPDFFGFTPEDVKEVYANRGGVLGGTTVLADGMLGYVSTHRARRLAQAQAGEIHLTPAGFPVSLARTLHQERGRLMPLFSGMPTNEVLEVYEGALKNFGGGGTGAIATNMLMQLSAHRTERRARAAARGEEMPMTRDDYPSSLRNTLEDPAQAGRLRDAFSGMSPREIIDLYDRTIERIGGGGTTVIADGMIATLESDKIAQRVLRLLAEDVEAQERIREERRARAAARAAEAEESLAAAEARAEAMLRAAEEEMAAKAAAAKAEDGES